MKHMVSQTKERSQAPEQLSLAIHLHKLKDDYSSAMQDVANFSSKPYMNTPATLCYYSSLFYLFPPNLAEKQFKTVNTLSFLLSWKELFNSDEPFAL